MLSAADRRILFELQNDFPLVADPYARIARRLKIDPAAFLDAVKALERRKRIRYIGATFDVKKAGCVSTLAALEVPRAKIAAVTAYIGRQPRITHNYLRPGRLNMWFTLSGFSRDDNARLIEDIRKRWGLSAAYDLATEKVYKIDARFDLGGAGRKNAPAQKRFHPSRKDPGVIPDKFLAVLSESIPAVPRPFRLIARNYRMSEEQVIAAFQEYLHLGFIRRFGAVLEHKRIGLRSNVMVAWEVDPQRVDALGRFVAGIPQVSHCYLRTSYPGWPFNLYSMIHGRTAAECTGIIELILRRNKHTIKQYRALRTLRELKKTRMDLRWMKR